MPAQVQAANANRSRFGYGMDTVPLSQLFTQRMWYPQHTTIPAQQAGQPVPSPAPAPPPPPPPVSDKLKIKMILGRVINPDSDVPTEEERAEFVASTKNVFADHVAASTPEWLDKEQGETDDLLGEIGSLLSEGSFSTKGKQGGAKKAKKASTKEKKEKKKRASAHAVVESPAFGAAPAEGGGQKEGEPPQSAEGGGQKEGEPPQSAEDGGREEEETPASAEDGPPTPAEGGDQKEGEFSESTVPTTESQREVTKFRDETLSGSDFESSLILCLIFPAYIDANRAPFPAEKQALIISTWWRDDFPYIILIELCKNLITGQSAIEEILQILQNRGESAVEEEYSITDDQTNRLDSIFGYAYDNDDDNSDGDAESNSDGAEEDETTAVVGNGGSPGPAPAKSPGKKSKKKQEEGVKVEESSYSPFRSDLTQEYNAWLNGLSEDKQISVDVLFFDNASDEQASSIKAYLDADADRILTTPPGDKDSLIRVLMSILSGTAKTLGKKSNKVFDKLLAKEFPDPPGDKPDTNWTGGKTNNSGKNAVLRYLRLVRPITVEMIAVLATLRNRQFGTDVGKVSKEMISPFLADGDLDEFNRTYDALMDANSAEGASGDVTNTDSDGEGTAPAEGEDGKGTAPAEGEGAAADDEDEKDDEGTAPADGEGGKGTDPTGGEYESAGNV